MNNRRFLAVILLVLLGANPGHATIISSTEPSAYLPPTFEQLDSATQYFGGTVGCTTDGSYNPGSLFWSQTGICLGDFNQVNGTLIGSWQANLSAYVDNSGKVLSGAFSLFGTVADAGITDVSLLASGNLVDAWYGSYEDTEFGSGFGTQTWALIDLDYTIDLLSGLGSELLWFSQGPAIGWTCGFGFECNAWKESYTGHANFTGTTYATFDGTFLSVPEPGTLALIGIGVAAIGALGRRRRLR